MRAEDKSFLFLAIPSYYDVPFFQRAYVWNEDNWSELFEDLTDRKKSHFLGSIILKNEMVPSGSIQRYLIIDGQQRLTTLSVLLRACYDHVVKNAEAYGYNENVINTCKVKMENFLFVSEGTLGNSKQCVKINHSKLDRVAFSNVVHGIYAQNDQWDKIEENDEDEISLIVLAYAFFRHSLQGITEEVFSNLWDVLTKGNSKFLVNIDLEADDDEQAIFDTVNSAGVRLSSEDTIKNLLFQRYVEILRKEECHDVEGQAVKEYEITWEDAFLKDDDLNTFWNIQKQYGRMKRSNLETFLHSFAVIVGFFDPSEHNMVDLPRRYKEYVAEMSRGEMEQFLTLLHDYSLVYAEYFEEGDEVLSFDNRIGRIMNICSALEVSTFYPYILQQLYAFYKKELSEKELNDRLFELERYVIINAICKGSTKNYNKECIQLVEGKKTANDIFTESIYISEDSFKTGLRKMTTNAFPTLLLFWVELFLRNKEADYTDVKELKYVYTLEHIMPQKWQQNWSDVEVYGADNQIVESLEEAEVIRRRAIYEIGNMTLLKSKLNSSVSNGTFNEKKEGKNGKKGLKDIVDLKITREVIENEHWDERAIRERTALIEERIREIWEAKELPENVVPKTKVKNESTSSDLRLEFWKYALPIIQEMNGYESYTNNHPSSARYMNGSFGIGGFSTSCTATYDFARVDFYMGSSNEEKNKRAYDILFRNKEEIEKQLGANLDWDRGDGYKAAWITYTIDGVNISQKEDWPKIASFLGEWSTKLRRIMVPYLEPEFPIDTTGDKTPEERKRLLEISAISIEWAEKKEEVIDCFESCNRSYTRFMTNAMSLIFPDTKNSTSAWNTPNHYFYEIVNRDGKHLFIQLALSFRNATEDFINRTKQIEELTGCQKKPNSNWLVPFTSSFIELPEIIDKEELFKELDLRFEELKTFEKMILESLGLV